jgi:hypothetical protein
MTSCYTHLESVSHVYAFTRRVTFMARLTQHGNFTSSSLTHFSRLPAAHTLNPAVENP